MGRRIPIEVGEYYHVYNRGVDKRTIFLDRHDHLRFLALLYICNSSRDVDIFNFLIQKEGPTFFDIFGRDRGQPLVAIGAYCLMPNHFHILVREVIEGGTSNFMKKVATGYAMYFNHRYKRSGTLFQGRYKAEHINSDSYLKYLYAYIHLNPIKLDRAVYANNGDVDVHKAKMLLSTYEYSSYHAHLGKPIIHASILESQAFPEYFRTPDELQDLLHTWLTYTHDNDRQ